MFNENHSSLFLKNQTKFLFIFEYFVCYEQHLGDDASIINDIVSGRHPLSKRLENAKKPVIIVGVDQLGRPDGEAILSALYEYGKKLSKDVRFIYFEFTKKNYIEMMEFICLSNDSRDGTHSMYYNVQHRLLELPILVLQTLLMMLSHQSQRFYSCWALMITKSRETNCQPIALSFTKVIMEMLVQRWPISFYLERHIRKSKAPT